MKPKTKDNLKKTPVEFGDKTREKAREFKAKVEKKTKETKNDSAIKQRISEIDPTSLPTTRCRDMVNSLTEIKPDLMATEKDMKNAEIELKDYFLIDEDVDSDDLEKKMNLINNDPIKFEEFYNKSRILTAYADHQHKLIAKEKEYLQRQIINTKTEINTAKTDPDFQPSLVRQTTDKLGITSPYEYPMTKYFEENLAEYQARMNSQIAAENNINQMDIIRDKMVEKFIIAETKKSKNMPIKTEEPIEEEEGEKLTGLDVKKFTDYIKEKEKLADMEVKLYTLVHEKPNIGRADLASFIDFNDNFYQFKPEHKNIIHEMADKYIEIQSDIYDYAEEFLDENKVIKNHDGLYIKFFNYPAKGKVECSISPLNLNFGMENSDDYVFAYDTIRFGKPRNRKEEEFEKTAAMAANSDGVTSPKKFEGFDHGGIISIQRLGQDKEKNKTIQEHEKRHNWNNFMTSFIDSEGEKYKKIEQLNLKDYLKNTPENRTRKDNSIFERMGTEEIKNEISAHLLTEDYTRDKMTQRLIHGYNIGWKFENRKEFVTLTVRGVDAFFDLIDFYKEQGEAQPEMKAQAVLYTERLSLWPRVTRIIKSKKMDK